MKILDILHGLCYKYDDLRFGQLLYNFCIEEGMEGIPFNEESGITLERLRKHIKQTDL